MSQFTGERGKAVVSIQVGDIYQAVLRAIMEASDPTAVAHNTCVAVEKRANIWKGQS